MSITENILNRFGFVSQKQMTTTISEAVKREVEQVQSSYKAELDKIYLWQSQTADAQRWTMPDPSIFANQADLYRLSPTLGTALDILAGDIGTSKFNVKRLRGEEEIDIPNHEFELLLHTPNPMDSGIELMQYTISNYKLNGNSIWWLNRADRYSKIDEIWTIPFSQIEPVPDGRLYLSHYNYLPGGGKAPIRFEVWEIVHFKTYNPNNRFVGLSPLESLVSTITGDVSMRKTTTSTYADNGGMPPSILAFKDYVPNDQWNEVKEKAANSAKRNEMMLLRGVGDGVTWLSRAVSNKDQEYIASLKQNMTDIFNRMCPGLLSMLSENATEANALAARATYSEKTLWVMEEVIAQKITNDILPAYGIKLRGHFDDPRVVDRKLKLEEQAAYERTHTLEEVRKEFYQDDPLGDERDDLLLAELNKVRTTPQDVGALQNPQPGQVQVNKVPQPLLPAPQANPQPAEQMAITDTGAQDMSMKAAIDDLMRWRKMALRGKDKAKDFVSEYIPLLTMTAIKTKLTMFSDKDAVAQLFDSHIEAMKPKPQVDSLQILRGIELGVKALEATK